MRKALLTMTRMVTRLVARHGDGIDEDFNRLYGEIMGDPRLRLARCDADEARVFRASRR